jgi:hypothetical protein
MVVSAAPQADNRCMVFLGVVLLIIGGAFVLGSSALQLAGFDPGRGIAPKYVWREFRRFGRGALELGLIALCLAIVLH